MSTTLNSTDASWNARSTISVVPTDSKLPDQSTKGTGQAKATGKQSNKSMEEVAQIKCRQQKALEHRQEKSLIVPGELPKGKKRCGICMLARDEPHLVLHNRVIYCPMADPPELHQKILAERKAKTKLRRRIWMMADRERKKQTKQQEDRSCRTGERSDKSSKFPPGIPLESYLSKNGVSKKQIQLLQQKIRSGEDVEIPGLMIWPW